MSSQASQNDHEHTFHEIQNNKYLLHPNFLNDELELSLYYQFVINCYTKVYLYQLHSIQYIHLH